MAAQPTPLYTVRCKDCKHNTLLTEVALAAWKRCAMCGSTDVVIRRKRGS